MAGQAFPQMAPGHIAGTQAKAFMDEAYPGTNAFERLSGGGGSAVGGATASAQNAKEMQAAQLSTQERIAERSARAQVITSAMPHGARGIASGLAALNGEKAEDFDTLVKQARERQPQVINQLSTSSQQQISQAAVNAANAQAIGARQAYEDARAELARLLARADVFRGMPRELATPGMAESIIDDALKGGQGPAATLMNNYEKDPSPVFEGARSLGAKTRKWLQNNPDVQQKIKAVSNWISGIGNRRPAIQQTPTAARRARTRAPVQASTHYKTTPDL